MNTNIVTKTVSINGKDLTLETGKVGFYTNAVTLQMGGTTILATVSFGPEREGVDFFPLSVEYIEKHYAGGMISSSRYIKRERFPEDHAILTARFIDRSVRPLFPKSFKQETQIIVTVLSYDPEYDPGLLGVMAVSAAIGISELPVTDIITGARIGFNEAKDGFELMFEDKDNGDVDLALTISLNEDIITMLEVGAREIPEEQIIDTLQFARDSIAPLIEVQKELIAEAGKEKMSLEEAGISKELLDAIHEHDDELTTIIYDTSKEERDAKMDAFTEKMIQQHGNEDESNHGDIHGAVEKAIRHIVHEKCIKEGKRPDGRALDEIRSISCEVGLLPRTHASALFTRGTTQALTVATLGSLSLSRETEGMTGENTKRYMHHYNFPPFSTGEAGRYRYMPGRREIGHGALAEKALVPVIPSKEDFPYTIRLVSEILASNGSSSMASTCGSTLALMDAGVPIIRPVAGIAMGLMYDEESGEYAVISDLEGFEDHFGDMDFKVTGTEKGVTALQMDNKVKGISIEILKDAIIKAQAGRMHILETMLKTINSPRDQVFAVRSKGEADYH